LYEAHEKGQEMTVIRCQSCNGSGLVMGGGMLTKSCENCDGSGKKDDGNVTIQDIKETESYKNAIVEIKKLDPSMSEEKAKEIFNEQFKKLDKPKRGRPKK